MFAKTTLLQFFPTFVWVLDLKPEDAGPLSAAIARTVEAALPRDHDGRGEHSLQSGTHLHEMPEFRPLVSHALAAGKEILKFLQIAPAPLTITGCWANVSAPNARHHEHSHPNNFLSGVYYVKAPKGGDSINFHDPRPQAHVVAPHVTSYSLNHASVVNVGVKEGSMVIFPAWLRHSVDPNRSSGQRMSVAFNMMFEDFTGQQSRTRFMSHFLTRSGS